MTNQVEEALLSAYLITRFPNAERHVHVRLGALPDISIPGLDPIKARRLAMPGLPEIDAVVVQGGLTYLIEAKVAKEWDCLGKMLIYRYLLPQTAGWENVDMTKVIPLLVLGRATAALKNCASVMGVSVDVFSIPAVEQILTYGYPSQQK